jgi:hypothetical protein
MPGISESSVTHAPLPRKHCWRIHLKQHVIIESIDDVLHGERELSRSHAMVLVRLCCLFPAASVLRDLATFYEHFTTRLLPLFMELLGRRGAPSPPQLPQPPPPPVPPAPVALAAQ